MLLIGWSMKYPVYTFGIKILYCIDVSCAKIKQCSPSYNPMLSLFPFFLFIFKSNFLSCSLCSQAVWRWGWRPDSGLRWSTTPDDPLLTGTISDLSQVLELATNTSIFISQLIFQLWRKIGWRRYFLNVLIWPKPYQWMQMRPRRPSSVSREQNLPRMNIILP